MELKIERLYKQAVDAALSKDWKTAIELHTTILEMDHNYIDSYLAMAFAYMQMGDLKAAKAHYKSALDIDPVNIIALNNVDKINILMKKGGSLDYDASDVVVTSETFMHTEGKTRVVTLSNIGQADVLAMLKIGERVELKLKKRRVEVRNRRGDYVGCLPDDISKRLAFFLEAGSEYETIIKAATKNSVDIFIKEQKKGSSVKNYISFPENIQDDLKAIMNKDADDPDNLHEEDDEEDVEIEDIYEQDHFSDLDDLGKDREDDEVDYMSDIDEEDDDDEDLDE